ncbi:hypothetical protein LSAT2_015892 [Lamellibrachia satsuma]|nr:hypothetical protein LSAT2_015892 [Lamellibrachia satsuma]
MASLLTHSEQVLKEGVLCWLATGGACEHLHSAGVTLLHAFHYAYAVRLRLPAKHDVVSHHGAYYYNHGIAVDVISRLVYYTGKLIGRYADELILTGFVAATTLEGDHHFLLITILNDVPQDIVLDHIRGMMYWRLGFNIEAAAMDGAQRRILITVAGNSFGLTIDQKGQRLYWCRSRIIESASLDGSDLKVLANTEVALFFTTLLGENFYFTDRRHIWRINVSESAPTTHQVGPAFSSLINGLAGYSSQQNNGMTPDNFLLVADPFQESLYQINLANDSIWKLPRIQHKFSHVAYDPVAEKVYWRVGKSTRRANLDGTTEEYLSGSYLDYFKYGIAFDFVSRLWYYMVIDGYYSIVASTLDNRHRFLVITTSHRNPYDIVLDPVRG